MNGEPISSKLPWRVRAVSVPARTVVVAMLAGALSVCTRHQPKSYQIAIRNFAYEPPSIVVAAGDTIVWQNVDFVPHTATASDRAWDSGALAMDTAWRFVVTTPGKYSYYCVFHPNMQATIEAR